MRWLMILGVLLINIAMRAEPVEVIDIGGSLSIKNIKIRIFSEDSLQNFRIRAKSTSPIDQIKFSIELNEEFKDGGVEFFTNNIKWEQEKKVYWLTGIFGKPAEFHLMEKYIKIPATIKLGEKRNIAGKIRAHLDERVLAEAEFALVPPIQWRSFYEKLLQDKKKGYAALGILVILLWLVYDILLRKNKNRDIPLCSTRARFSTLLKENESILIEEMKNPFGCRLSGLKKQIKINYNGSEIKVRIGGKKQKFEDLEPASLKVNKHWKLKLEAQSFSISEEESEKSLVILLLPL